MGFRDWARSELKKSEQQRYARELGALGQKAKETTERGKAKLGAQRDACRQTVSKVRAAADETFQRDVTKARERRTKTVQPAKECCVAEAKEIKERTHTEKGRLQQQAQELRQERDMLKRLEQNGRRVKLTTAKERRSESDDEVLANVEPELHTLFHRVKRAIKGSDRRSRTEEFQQYVEEHPDEALQARADAADAWLAKELKSLAKTRGARPARRRASGEKVPF
jgi:hypothetical protein